MLRFPVLLIGILLVFSRINAQNPIQLPDQLPITLAIHGDYILGADSSVVVVDTYTGQVQIADELENARPVRGIRVDPQGEKIVYLDPLNLRISQSSLPGNPQVLLPYQPNLGIFSPQAWSSDSLYVWGIVSDGELGGYEIQKLNTETNLRETVLRFEENSPFSGNPDLLFNRILRVHLNSVQNEWIAMQIIAIPAGEQGNMDVDVIRLGIIKNYLTGETLLVNDLIADDLFSLMWLSDGKRILVNSFNHIHLIELTSNNNVWQLEYMTRADQAGGGLVLDSLGIQDLLLYEESNQSTFETTISVAQIINNSLFKTEFLKIPRALFSASPLTGVTSGSWHLRATQEERYELSCLFDQAQPARLDIGTRARVNFTNGVPLRLRDAPDFSANQITQMPEGTEFDVIGGKACVNASSYYRFWQIELDNGTVGWAAEADLTEYFMEPVNFSLDG